MPVPPTGFIQNLEPMCIRLGSDFKGLGIRFEARAVILEAWRLIFRISEMDVCFYRKKCLRGPPSKAHSNPFFTVLWFDGFFGVLYVVDFCDFQCPEIPFWRPFWSIFGSPGPLPKQLKVCNDHNF